MPYINKTKRDMIKKERFIDLLYIDTAGDLNYSITEMIKSFMVRKGLTYQTINDIVGALECSKLEFQRRVVGNYEDTKIKENGDVY